MRQPRAIPGRNERIIAAAMPAQLRDLRQAVGWTQRELAERARTSQSTVCRAELGHLQHVPLPALCRMFDALGAHLVLELAPPLVTRDRRQRDLVHARLSAYVADRLQRAGWVVYPEVEIHGPRAHGWVDALALEPRTGVVLVDETKTELHDIGALGRQLSWYEREAWAVARRLGWRPRRVVSAVFLLATAANDEGVRQNRVALEQLLPNRPADVDGLCATRRDGRPTRSLVLVDPFRRRGAWLLRSTVDGRRSPAPHADYGDVARKLTRSTSAISTANSHVNADGAARAALLAGSVGREK